MSTNGSPYACPVCSRPLSLLRGRTEELFCRTCGTAVVRVEGDHCLYMGPGASGLTRSGVLSPRVDPSGR